jgi:GH35 family endo-1,4-beta-xylanase
MMNTKKYGHFIFRIYETMVVRSLTIFIVFFFGASLTAQPKPLYDLLAQGQMASLNNKKGNIGSIALDSTNKENGHIVSTFGHVNNVWELSARIPLKDKVPAEGEKILIQFEGKSLKSSQETEEAKAMFVLSYAKNKEAIEQTISVSTEWKMYYYPIEFDGPIAKDVFRLALQYGYPNQQFYIRNLHVWVYPSQVKVEELPKTTITYAGMEANAAWRSKALDRIEKIRKGDANLKITLDGKDVKGNVDIKLAQHHFGFGVGIRALDVVEKPAILDEIAKNFNLIVFINDLKMKFWGRQVSKPKTVEILQACKSKNIHVKGHVLVWPGYRHLPDKYKQHKGKPDSIKHMVFNHLDDILSQTSPYIDRWDVVNELYTNKDLQAITSNEIIYDIFKKVKKEYPEFKRYINEYGIINKGGTNIEKLQWYYNYIKEIDANTSKAVDGIGIQAHFGTDLTPPEKILEILTKFEPLNKTISISEYTLDITDPVIRKLYTEDLMIAAFSHPNVNEFLFWGYQGSHKDKVDLITPDGKTGSMGEAYQNLVNKQWNTQLKTNVKDGNVSFKGFYGDYTVTFNNNGKEYTGSFSLSKNDKSIVKNIVLKKK